MKMDTDAVRARVRDVIAEMVGQRVLDSEPIVSSGLIDSLSVVNLITRLERNLNITIPQANLQPDDFDTVDLIVDTLQREAR
jgi:acyl carrier protein